MDYSLKNIFKSITPDNISSIPVIQDAMDVFIETIEELSKESIDIKNIYENESIKQELIKIYLDDLYKVIQQLQYNNKIIERIEKTNSYYGSDFYNKDSIFNLLQYINDEHFLTFRSYKESKGTKASLKYIYDLISIYINASTLTNDIESQTFFELNELEPFNFEINGVIPEEFYHYIIHPLAHPLGFSYVYNYLIKFFLEDFFPEKSIFYDIDSIEVRCLQTTGDTYIDSYTYQEKEQLVTELDLNFLTGEIIIDEEDNKWLIQTKSSNGLVDISEWETWTKTLSPVKFIDNVYLYNNTVSGHRELYYLGNHYSGTMYNSYYYTLTSTTDQVTLDTEIVQTKRTVVNYETSIISNFRTRKIFFDNDTYLMQVTSLVGQTNVFYMSQREEDRTENINDYYTFDLSEEDKLLGNYNIEDYDIIIIKYEDQCSLYFSYESIVQTTVKDILQIFDSKYLNDHWDRTNSTLASLYIGQERLNATLESEERNYIIEREGIDSIIFDDIDTESKFVVPDEIGEFYIGEMVYTVDQGFNKNLDRDGNILVGNDIGYEKGRFEHFFSPNYESDLKLLLGKFELNIPIYYDDVNLSFGNEVYYEDTPVYYEDTPVYYQGILIGIQPLKYTDIVNPSYKSLNTTLTVEEYTNDNKENFDYTAREHFMIEIFRGDTPVLDGNRDVLI